MNHPHSHPYGYTPLDDVKYMLPRTCGRGIAPSATVRCCSRWCASGAYRDEVTLVSKSLAAGETASFTMSQNALGQQNKLEPAFTDLDRIWFGKHSGECLQDVPESYLSWLWWEADYRLYKGETSQEMAGLVSNKTCLANYIWNSRNAINMELRDRDVRPIE